MDLPYELQVGWRYLRGVRAAGRAQRSGFISFIATLSVVGITLGVAALIVVLSVMNGFRTEVRDRMLDVIAHVELQAMGPAAPETAAWMASLQREGKIKAVAPYAAVQGLLGHGDLLRGAWLQGIDPAQEPAVSPLAERLSRSGPSGEAASLQKLRAGERKLLLGDDLAARLQLKPGDPVALVLPPTPSSGGAPRTLGFEVAGTFSSGHFQYDSAWALAHIDDIRALQGPSVAQGLRLRLNDASEAPQVAQALAERWPQGVRVRDWTQNNRTWFEAVAQQKRMLGLILTLIVAVAAFNLVSTLVMTVTDKRGDIAILRTLGASPRSVMGIFMVQGALAGLIGTVAGVALGLLVAHHIDVIVPAIERLLGTTLLPASVYLISSMPSQPLASDVVPIALVSVVLAFVSTLYPSWRASRLKPAQALRHE
jgi:lipoprotein-releasing system permease protein